MKHLFRAFAASLLLALCIFAQEPSKSESGKPAEPALQMMTYQMVLFREAPQHQKRDPKQADSEEKILGHLANLARLNRERKAVLYGPFTDPEPSAPTLQGLAGLAVMDVKDAAAAKAEFANDPYVASGDVVLEVKPWLGPKGWFAPPAQPAASDPNKMDVEPFVFGVLLRGSAAKAQPSVHTDAQRQEIQKGHLAYMDGLNQQGKLVAAGPFMEDGEWRGIVIYRVAGVKEAQALAAGDPAVKAGRLVIEARPWMTLKGILK